MAKEKEGKKEKFVLGSVATQTAPVVIDTSKEEEDEERVLSTEAALAQILNKLEDIEKIVG